MTDAERLTLAKKQMELAAKYIGRYYEACRNEHTAAPALDHARQMVFAIGADLKRITEEME